MKTPTTKPAKIRMVTPAGTARMVAREDILDTSKIGTEERRAMQAKGEAEWCTAVGDDGRYVDHFVRKA